MKDTDGSKLVAWNTANEDLYNMLFFTTESAACSVVRRFAGKTLDEGSGHGQCTWAPFREKFDGCSREALRAEHAKMNFERMSPGQDLDEFLYELDTRRKRFNACDPPEGPTDRQFEDTILQALQPEYECIRTLHLEKPKFGIAVICCMISAIYAANLDCSSLTTGIAGRGAAIHVPSAPSTSSSGNNENEQQNKQQGGRCQRGRQGRGKTSRRPPSNGGRGCSYHNTTNNSDADRCAIKTANDIVHVAADHDTHMQRISSARDTPDPKEDSERSFISFSVTEVTTSAATTASKQEKGTWPFGPSPATCPWPFAVREKPVVDFGRQSKHDPTYMFDTDGEGGPLYGTALISSPAPVAYTNASNCSNLAHVLVDSGASDHYFDDFLFPGLNRRFLDYACLTAHCKILTSGGALLDGTGEGIL